MSIERLTKSQLALLSAGGASPALQACAAVIIDALTAENERLRAESDGRHTANLALCAGLKASESRLETAVGLWTFWRDNDITENDCLWAEFTNAVHDFLDGKPVPERFLASVQPAAPASTRGTPLDALWPRPEPAAPARTAQYRFPEHIRTDEDIAYAAERCRVPAAPARTEAEQAVLDAMARADTEELAALVDGEIPDTPLWEIAACRSELARRGLK